MKKEAFRIIRNWLLLSFLAMLVLVIVSSAVAREQLERGWIWPAVALNAISYLYLLVAAIRMPRSG